MILKGVNNFNFNTEDQFEGLYSNAQTSPITNEIDSNGLYCISNFENLLNSGDNNDFNLGQDPLLIFSIENNDLKGENELQTNKDFNPLINCNLENKYLGKKSKPFNREDNLMRKIVNNVEKNIIKLINSLIKILNNNNEDKIQLLYPIQHDINNYYKIDHLKILMNTKFKIILAKPLNNKFSKTSQNSNIETIKKIYHLYYNDYENESEGKIIISILEKTLIEVLNFYNNKYKDNCLNGLEKYPILNKKSEEEEYFLKHFEEKILQKRSRKSKKRRNEDEKNEK